MISKFKPDKAVKLWLVKAASQEPQFADFAELAQDNEEEGQKSLVPLLSEH